MLRRIALALLLVSAAAQAQTSPAYAAADALVADSLAQLGGRAVLAVVGPEGVRHLRAFGPVGADAAVPIASATKWLSAAVLLSLVDSGEIALDTPVGQFFPEAPAAARAITVRQLFAHTSGIRSQAACLSSDTTTLDACARTILGLPLVAAPGAAFVYGGASMHVAGALAERAAGRAWADLFEARVAGPLGMEATTYGTTANPWIGGGATSTAADYGRFLQMLLLGGVAPPGAPAAGQRVLSEASVAAMLADQTAGAPVAFSPYTPFVGAPGGPEAQPRYGVGVWRERTDAAGALAVATSPGAFGFTPWIDVAARTAGVLLVVSRFEDVAWTAFELRRRVAAVGPVAGEEPAADAAPGARLGAPRPNPVGARATIPFELAEAATVRLELADALGRAVAVLADGPRAAGRHEAALAPRGLAAGTYLAVLRVDGAVAGRRLVTLR